MAELRRSFADTLAELERAVDAAAEAFVDTQFGWMWSLPKKTPAQIEQARQALEQAIAAWEARRT